MTIIFSDEEVKELEVLNLDELIDTISEVDEIEIPRDVYFE